jgi:two-component system chemotaxis response regulator CheB
MTPVRVAVVDDSAICRHRLRSIIEADGDLEVVVELAGGHDVVAALESSRAAVLVTDLMMPEVDGLSVVRQVMRDHPVPILVVSSAGFTAVSAFEATRLGALEVAAKPEFGDRAAETALRAALRRVADVPVVRHPGHISTQSPPATLPPAALESGPALDAVGIGASAGGPPALVTLLGALPAKGAPPILIAQHLPSGHAEAFARFLASRCPFEVHVARRPIPLRPGHVVIPDDDAHLALDGSRFACSLPTREALSPRVDVLLTSLAERIGARAAGVVLSGIGEDGAVGLEALRAVGALTIAQDEGSSAVYGMPKAAAPSARLRLPPREIARAIAMAGTAHHRRGRG